MGFMQNLKRSVTIAQLRHVGGHPDLPTGRIVAFGRQEGNLIILRNTNEHAKEFTRIPLSDILNVSMQQASKSSVGRAAAGALVGGVLTGGVGALAGAAIGGRNKDQSVIVMTLKHGPMTLDVLFGQAPGQPLETSYSKLAALLKP